MKSLFEEHGVLISFLALIALVGMTGASQETMRGFIIGGAFFCIYDKLSGILIALKSDRVLNLCISMPHLNELIERQKRALEESNERG